jgi:IS5 family transposase
VEAVPDETTICRFRQRLIQCGHEQLLGLPNEQLERKGCVVKLEQFNRNCGHKRA